jgi:NADH dehydrogenase [ubiquinone] 1 alpha subcomplex assembly factor 6
MPIESRKAFFAIRALNIELATIRDVTSNATLGRMRMQWWRLTLKDIYAVK